MLDDLVLIHQRDAQDALGIAAKEWQQLSHQYVIENKEGLRKPQTVVFAGMGGSAFAGLLATTWPTIPVPFEICRTYSLPQYVNEDTLVIASSASGNTEETLTALEEAKAKGAQIAVIAGGGKLLDIAAAENLPYVHLASASQPRFGVFYGLRAFVEILIATELAPESTRQMMDETSTWLKDQTEAWLPTVPQASNPAKQLALECIGKSPVIYASNLFYPAAYKWKIGFNENAKNVAWCNYYPEFNHNEFIGWSSHPQEKPYTVIDLRSSLDNPRIQKRFELSDKLLSGKRPAAHTVQLGGETSLQQLAWAVTFGDFVSLYVALLNGLNPSPVDLVERLKKELV